MFKIQIDYPQHDQLYMATNFYFNVFNANKKTKQFFWVSEWSDVLKNDFFYYYYDCENFFVEKRDVDTSITFRPQI